MRLIFILILLASIQSIADLQTDFSLLKNRGRNLQDTGAICEEVAQLKIKNQYPETQYQVVTSIQYSDQDGPVGELDVIVFNKNNHKAVLIAEVKCWKNIAAAKQKAFEQKKRFFAKIHSKEQVDFIWLPDPRMLVSKEQFADLTQFISIGQKGTTKQGFDMELDYSLEELKELRDKIMQCQSTSDCKEPRFY